MWFPVKQFTKHLQSAWWSGRFSADCVCSLWRLDCCLWVRRSLLFELISRLAQVYRILILSEVIVICLILIKSHRWIADCGTVHKSIDTGRVTLPSYRWYLPPKTCRRLHSLLKSFSFRQAGAGRVAWDIIESKIFSDSSIYFYFPVDFFKFWPAL